MSSTSNNAAVTGNDAVDDVMATSQSAENGTSHDTADGDIKNDVLSIARYTDGSSPPAPNRRAANMLSTHAVAKAASWPRSGNPTRPARRTWPRCSA